MGLDSHIKHYMGYRRTLLENASEVYSIYKWGHCNLPNVKLHLNKLRWYLLLSSFLVDNISIFSSSYSGRRNKSCVANDGENISTVVDVAEQAC